MWMELEQIMRPYMPTYGSPAEYFEEINASPMRQTLMQVVEMSRQFKINDTPRLEFAPTGQTYGEELNNAQKSVAYNMQSIDQLLAVFGKGDEEAYQAEESPRWRAWYDLNYGRLLAMAVRNREYNWACAVMKGKGPAFVQEQSNRWLFKPSEKINFGSATEKLAERGRCIIRPTGQLHRRRHRAANLVHRFRKLGVFDSVGFNWPARQALYCRGSDARRAGRVFRNRGEATAARVRGFAIRFDTRIASRACVGRTETGRGL